MHSRVWAAGGAAVAAVGLAGALAGCASPASGNTGAGSQPGMHAPSTSPGPSSSGAAGALGGAPNIPVVELDHSFSPSTLRLGVGQHFELIVGKDVRVSGLNVDGCAPGRPTPVPGGLLSVVCTSPTVYTYNVEHSGTATLAATVRPRCSAGMMCPQWIAEPTLKVTISS